MPNIHKYDYLGLPIASETDLGVVAVDGVTIIIDPVTGIISAIEATYTLPTASTTVKGGVKVDGTSITINATTGVISSNAGYPAASTTVLGGVIVPTTGRLTVDGSGNIGVALSSSTVFGVVKVDNASIISTAGVISATGVFAGGFGCNTKTAQTAYASGGAVDDTASSLASYGFTETQADGIVTLLNNIQAALVACGIMS